MEFKRNVLKFDSVDNEEFIEELFCSEGTNCSQRVFVPYASAWLVVKAKIYQKHGHFSSKIFCVQLNWILFKASTSPKELEKEKTPRNIKKTKGNRQFLDMSFIIVQKLLFPLLHIYAQNLFIKWTSLCC